VCVVAVSAKPFDVQHQLKESTMPELTKPVIDLANLAQQVETECDNLTAMENDILDGRIAEEVHKTVARLRAALAASGGE
jgi:hypothetical protein